MSDDDPPAAGGAVVVENLNTGEKVELDLSPTAEPNHRAKPSAVPAL